MLLALASYSACSRSSSDKRMVKFFLGSTNCPLRPISNPFFRFFFFIRHWKFLSNYHNSKTCAERICQIRKTQCVLQNLVRGSKIPPKTLSIYAPAGQLSVIRYAIRDEACITAGITKNNLVLHPILLKKPIAIPGIFNSYNLAVTNLPEKP